MLRAERPRPSPEANGMESAHLSSRALLLAVAPPPRTNSFALSGWPSWLIPQYRSGGHRPEVRLLEEEER